MSSPSATPNTHAYQNQLRWSKSEKIIARTAFDAALKPEFQDIMVIVFKRQVRNEEDW